MTRGRVVTILAKGNDDRDIKVSTGPTVVQQQATRRYYVVMPRSGLVNLMQPLTCSHPTF